MPVPNSMADLAQLASANFPTGTESIGNNLDNYLRAHASIMRSTYAVASATLASASTTNLASADGESVRVTGTATINSFGTGYVGCKREVIFDSALTIVASSNIIVPVGSNVVTIGGDTFTFRCTSPGVWVMVGSPSLGVRKSGDVMTGPLTLFGLSTGSQFNALSFGYTNNIVRWRIVLDNNDFSLWGYDASGGTPTKWWNVERGSGNASFASNLSVNGTITASGNIISNSDESLKDDWSDLPDGLVESLASLKAGEYTRTDIGRRQIGVSANNLESFMPCAVESDSKGIRSVAYGNAALVGVVALARKVLEMEARFNAAA